MNLTKIYLNLLFLCIVINNCLSQNSDYRLNLAFKSINEKNYFKAKKILSKTLEKEIIASSFGLSKIFSTNNSFYNIDSAWYMITITNTNYTKLDLRQKQSLIKFSIHPKTITDLENKIIKLHFELSKEKNTIKHYESFINKFQSYPIANEAKELMSILDFNRIESSQSELEFKNFIDKYPNSSKVKEAKNKQELLTYKNITKDSSLDSFEKYLNLFPNGYHTEEAKMQIYKIYTKNQKLDDYEGFIRKYPENPNVNKAWKNLYDKYFICHTNQELNIFIKEYPDFPYKSILEEQRKFINKSMLPIKKNSKYGFIDNKGEIIINPKYEFVGEFKCGLAICANSIKVGYINKKGEEIIPFVYDEGFDFIDGIAVVDSSNLLGIIDIHNEKILPFEYDEIIRFSNNFFIIKKNEVVNIINSHGDNVFNLKFDDIKVLENFLSCSVNGKYGLIDSSMMIKTDFIYDEIKRLKKDKFIIQEKGKYGIIDINGKELIKAKYNYLGSSDGEMILFLKNKKYGYLNQQLKVQIKANYKTYNKAIENYFFKGKYAISRLKNKYGLLDKMGNMILPRMFDKVINTDVSQFHAKKKASGDM